EWWKLLRAVIKLLKPFCVFTHKLKADIPYLSQLLPIWHILLKHAEEWVSRDNPSWTLGVLDLLRERRAKGYWPVMPAAYMLDGLSFAPPKDKPNAPPQPPFGLLSL
ncbi:hypothetical protein HaLaN_27886, partial [Haematococcus lacustris]